MSHIHLKSNSSWHVQNPRHRWPCHPCPPWRLIWERHQTDCSLFERYRYNLKWDASDMSAKSFLVWTWKCAGTKNTHRKLKLENWWPYNPSIWCFVGMAPQESYEQAAVKSREQHFKRSRVSEKCIPALKTWIRCDLNAKKGTGLHPGGSTASFRLEKFNELRCLQPD